MTVTARSKPERTPEGDISNRVRTASAGAVITDDATTYPTQIPSEYPRDAVRAAHAEGFRRGVEAAADLMTKYLVYDSQRAVSWHEIQDTLDAIRALRPEGDKHGD